MSKIKNLLFEIGTEELPVTLVKNLSKQLLHKVVLILDKLNINYKNNFYFSTPRRISFLIEDIASFQSRVSIKKKGPFIPENICFNDFNKYLLNFAIKMKVSEEDVSVVNDKNRYQLLYRYKSKCHKTVEIFPNIIKEALSSFSKTDMMRWSDENIYFFRPVHWIVLLADNIIIPCNILGLCSSNITYGHRFHCSDSIVLKNASHYINILRNEGKVIADFSERKNILISKAKSLATSKKLYLAYDNDFIEDLTSIVEWPEILCCYLDLSFLYNVPQEIIILILRKYQKCIPMLDRNGKLTNYFLIICNVISENSDIVVDENIKVILAKFNDLLFFYNKDINKSIEYYLLNLKNVIFKNELGSLYDKTHRIALLSKYIAKVMNIDSSSAYRAGLLSKLDLLMNIVYEFPELQGIFGKYYAKANNEEALICDSIEQQYWPKNFSSPLPKSVISQALSIADKIDTLVGMFIIEHFPTSRGDPFGLRRLAIGILRILKEKKCPIILEDIIDYALSLYGNKCNVSCKTVLLNFFIGRLKFIYKKELISIEIFYSVLSSNYTDIFDFDCRVKAVLKFLKVSHSLTLINNNKRILNILMKHDCLDKSFSVDSSLFTHIQEKNLYDNVINIEKLCFNFITSKDYFCAFSVMIKLNDLIINFFSHVMISDINVSLQNNRLALLQKIYILFKLVADISKL